MFAAMGLFTVVLQADQVRGPCYVLYAAGGQVVYQDRQPPFSLASPPSTEAEASRRRGERLMVLTDLLECPRIPPPATVPPAADTGNPVVPREPAPAPAPKILEGRIGNGSFSVTRGRPAGDPEAKTPYDPFATGQVPGGLAGGLERIRRSAAEGRVGQGASPLDTAAIAETEAKQAAHRAAMEVARQGGERAYDTAYNCYLGRDPENCIGGSQGRRLVDLAIRPATTPEAREQRDQALAALETLGRSGALVNSGALPGPVGQEARQSPQIVLGGGQAVAGSPLERTRSALLARAMAGDPAARELLLALEGQIRAEPAAATPGRVAEAAGQTPAVPALLADAARGGAAPVTGDGQVAAPLPVAPLARLEQAALAAAQGERRWWVFQFPPDRRRVTERFLELLRNSPPPVPRLDAGTAERLATEEERQRRRWWLFQLSPDTARIARRTLEILEQADQASNPYRTRAEVFEAVRAGRLSEEQALRYLKAMPES